MECGDKNSGLLEGGSVVAKSKISLIRIAFFSLFLFLLMESRFFWCGWSLPGMMNAKLQSYVIDKVNDAAWTVV